MFNFIGKFQNVSKDAVPFCISNGLAFLPMVLIVRILVSLSLILAMLTEVCWYFVAILICIPQITGDVEYFHVLFTCISSLVKCPNPLPIFKNWVFCLQIVEVWEFLIYSRWKYMSDMFFFSKYFLSVCLVFSFS